MFRLRFLRSGAVRALAVGSLGVQSCPTLTVRAGKEPVSAEPRLKSTLISSFFQAPPRPGRPASSALPLKKRGRPAMQAVPLELGDLPDCSSDVAPSPSPLPPVASVTTPGSAKRQRSRYDRGADYDRLRVAVEDWLGSCGAYLELDEHNQTLKHFAAHVGINYQTIAPYVRHDASKRRQLGGGSGHGSCLVTNSVEEVDLFPLDPMAC